VRNIGWFRVIGFCLTLILLVASFSCKAPTSEAQAQFEVISLGVDPCLAATGQEIAITARIANIGDAQGTYTAMLKVDGAQIEKKDVTVAPRSSEWVTFTIVRDVTGTYLVNVGDMTTTGIVGLAYPVHNRTFIKPKLTAENVTEKIYLESGYEIPLGRGRPRMQTYDDVVAYAPEGLVNYRANVRRGQNWVPGPDYVREAEMLFSGCQFAPLVKYRGHIETEAGQTRYNLFWVDLLDKSIGESIYRQYEETEAKPLQYSIKLAETIPDIQVINVNPHMSVGLGYHLTDAQFNLVIETSPQIKPGDYTLRFIVDANGQNCGELPCFIHVKETIPERPYIKTAWLPNGLVEGPYLQTLSATSGTGSYTWSVIGGSLPDGLSLDPGGVISGTPTTVDFYSFIVQVNDGITTAVQPLSIAVNNGRKRLGSDDATVAGTSSGQTLILDRYLALNTDDYLALISDNVTQIRVKCTAAGNIKVALYADDDSSPGVMLSANNRGTSVVTGWNNISLPPTAIIAGKYYWIAYLSSTPCVGYTSDTGDSYMRCYNIDYSSNLETWTIGNLELSVGSGQNYYDKHSLTAGWWTPEKLY
jgi:hypothetical protein